MRDNNPTPATVPMTNFGEQPDRVIERVRVGDRLILMRQGVQVAALIPLKDLRFLLECEGE